MKQLSTTLLLVLYIGLSIGTTQTIDPIINDIDVKFDKIWSNLDNYSKKTIPVMDESTEGGEAEAYFDNKELKLLAVTWLGEMGKRRVEYYYDKRQLIFALDQEVTYNRPIYYDEERARENNDKEAFDPKKSTIKENRFYFDNNELLLWLNEQSDVVDLFKEKNANKGKEVLTHANKVRKEFK